MNNKDVWLGLKVVPKSKSVGKSLRMSEVYNSRQFKEQGFLYVAHQHATDRKSNPNTFLLTADVNCIRMCGDYYNVADFEPYIETNSDAEEVNKLEWNEYLTVSVYSNNVCKILDKTTDICYTAFAIDFKETGLSPTHYALCFFDMIENIKYRRDTDISSQYKWKDIEELISKIYNKPREEVFPPKKESKNIGFISVGIKR